MAPSVVLAFLLVLPLAMGQEVNPLAATKMVRRVLPAVADKSQEIKRIVDKIIPFVGGMQPSRHVKVVDDDDYDYYMCDGSDDDDAPAPAPVAAPVAAPGTFAAVTKAPLPTPVRRGSSSSSGKRKFPTLIANIPKIISDTVKLAGVRPVKSSGSDKVVKSKPVPIVGARPVLVKEGSSGSGRRVKVTPVQIKVQAPVLNVAPFAPVQVKVEEPVRVIAARPVLVKEGSSGRKATVKVDQVQVKVQAPVPVVAARPVLVKEGSSGRKATVKVDQVQVKVQAPVPVAAVRPAPAKQASSASGRLVKVASTPIRAAAKAPVLRTAVAF